MSVRNRFNRLERMLDKGMIHAQEGGGGGPFSTSFTDITGGLSDIFGGSTSQEGATTGTTKRTAKQTERLKIDEAAIQKIIQDVLGGAEGLASIFAGEQTAGIFDSSVAAQAAGDLAAKLTGEIAKLTAEKETTQEEEAKTRGTSEQEAGTEGLLGTIGGGIESGISSIGSALGF
jgi:hypothetical protein